MLKAIETKDDKGDMKIENVESEAIETKDNNDLTENKSCEQTQGIKNQENMTKKRGLVVICVHTTFDSPKDLPYRRAAFSDLKLMKKDRESFDCKVVDFKDKQTSFDKNELTNAIEEELKNIPDSKFFVFVLSTHGETFEEADLKSTKHSSQHTFYTKDAQFTTYDLMKNISTIEILKTKQKIFVIQACRSKAQGVNVDLGYEIEITSIRGNNSDTKSDTTEKENDKLVVAMDQSRNVKRMFTEIHEEISSNENFLVEDIPLCEESVLLFATTSGKFAFQINYGENTGGLAITKLNKIMAKAQEGAKLYITDILTQVNYEVQNARIECKMKQRVPLAPDFDGMNEIEFQQLLENHVNELIRLSNLCIPSDENQKYNRELEDLREKIIKNNTKDILINLKNKVNETSNYITGIEKTIPIKCQSCFYHNLSFDTDEVYLKKSNKRTREY